MTRIVLSFLITITLSETALAFDPTDPGASGYSLVFSDNFASSSTFDFTTAPVNGAKWYTRRFFTSDNPANRAGWLTFNDLVCDSASLCLSGLTFNQPIGNNGSYVIATAAPSASAPFWVGTAFSGGAYFEAEILMSNPSELGPAFWSLDIAHMAGLNNTCTPTPCDNYIEDDFFENDIQFLPNGSGPGNKGYGVAIHDWYSQNGNCPQNGSSGHCISGNNSSTNGTPYSNFVVAPTNTNADIDWTKWHTIGQLWTSGPQNGGAGCFQNYFDGQPAQSTGTGTFSPLAKECYTDPSPLSTPINVNNLQTSSGGPPFNPEVWAGIDQPPHGLVIVIGADQQPSGGPQLFHVAHVNVWQLTGAPCPCPR